MNVAPGAGGDAGFPIDLRSIYRFPRMPMICGRSVATISSCHGPRPSRT